MKSLIVPAAILLIAGCSSDGDKRPDYLDSHTLEGLQVPPHLTEPDTRAELKIPEPSAKALALLRSQENAKGTVAPVFKEVKFKSANGLFWVEIHETPEVLWPKLKDFWAHEGIKLSWEEPLLGIMETEWLKEFKASELTGEKSGWFSSFSPDLKDRFRMRIERVNNKRLSRIYVSHRGLEIEVSEIDEISTWVHRPAEPILEREILLRLVLFTGLSKIRAKDMFAGYRAYHPRVRTLSEDEARYAIIGRKEFVWPRVLQAIDRLGVEIRRKDPKAGRIDLLVGKLEKVVQQQEEEDELAESSWLGSMFNSDDEDLLDKEGRLGLSLQLKMSSRETIMEMKLANNQPVSGGLGGQFRDNLLLLLK